MKDNWIFSEHCNCEKCEDYRKKRSEIQDEMTESLIEHSEFMRNSENIKKLSWWLEWFKMFVYFFLIVESIKYIIKWLK